MMNMNIIQRYRHRFTGDYKIFFQKHYVDGNVHVFEEEYDVYGKLAKLKFYWDDGDYIEISQECIRENSDTMNEMFVELVQDLTS
tara:strand:- start:603 stop:857 length:255 start_codon:yes stop_codon:yes gene_type:complete